MLWLIYSASILLEPCTDMIKILQKCKNSILNWHSATMLAAPIMAQKIISRIFFICSCSTAGESGNGNKVMPRMATKLKNLKKHPSPQYETRGQILSPWLGDKVYYDIGSSYQTARLYDNLMPQLTISPSQGLRILQQYPRTKKGIFFQAYSGERSGPECAGL